MLEVWISINLSQEDNTYTCPSKQKLGRKYIKKIDNLVELRKYHTYQLAQPGLACLPLQRYSRQIPPGVDCHQVPNLAISYPVKKTSTRTGHQ